MEQKYKFDNDEKEYTRKKCNACKSKLFVVFKATETNDGYVACKKCNMIILKLNNYGGEDNESSN